MLEDLILTSFLAHVLFVCTQSACKQTHIFRELQEFLRIGNFFARLEKPHAITITWSYDMEGHAKKCLERYCELANKTTQQLYKVSTPCIDYHHLKEEEMKSVGELSQVRSQIVLKFLLCTYWKT